MGLIWTAIVYAVLAAINIWCSRLLVEVKAYCDTHVRTLYISLQVAIKVSKANNWKRPCCDYLSCMNLLIWSDELLVIRIFGLHHISCLVFDVCMGCSNCNNRMQFFSIHLLIHIMEQISVTDFACSMPQPETILDPSSKRTVLLWATTAIILILVLLHDMKPIVTVASFSIFALVISFSILLVYGLITYKLTWKMSFLFPMSVSSLLSSIGVPSFSLGYNFSYLSFYVSIGEEQ